MAVMRWSDMDALGHVHNARMLEYFEAARVELIQEVLDLGRIEPADIGLIVRRHEIDYLAPLVFRPTPIAVDMSVERIGSSSFTLAYSVGEPDNSITYASAITVIVAVTASSGRPTEIPQALRDHLIRYSSGEGD